MAPPSASCRSPSPRPAHRRGARELLTAEAMLRVGFPIDVGKDLQERAEALFARPQCRLGAFVIRNVHHRSTRPSVPFSRPTPRTAQPIGVSRVISNESRDPTQARPQDQRHQLHFECRPCPMKRRRALPARELRRARPECRFAARLRVDSHVHVRRCTNTSRERAEPPGAILASKKRHESAGPGTDVGSLADRRQLPARLLSGTRPAPVSSPDFSLRARAGVGGRSASLASCHGRFRDHAE